MYDTIITVLLLYLRMDKDSDRSCFTEIFDQFLPHVLVALEHGFATTTLDARATTSWNSHTELMDALFMGVGGKHNLNTLFADTVLRRRIFRLFTALPIIPSSGAQFNLYLAATRVLRHARKVSTGIVEELENLGTISVEELSDLSHAKDHRVYAYAKLEEIQKNEYHQGKMQKYFARKFLYPTKKGASSTDTSTVIQWLNLPSNVAGVFTVPITDFLIPSTAETEEDMSTAETEADEYTFCGYADKLAVSLAGLSSIILRPFSNYNGPRPTQPISTTDRSIGRLTIEDIGWNTIERIEMNEKLLRLSIISKTVTVDECQNMKNDRKLAYVFPTIEDLTTAWVTIIRLRPSMVTLRRYRSVTKNKKNVKEWINVTTLPDDEAVQAHEVFQSASDALAKQLMAQPKPVSDNSTYPNNTYLSIDDEDAARITHQADDFLLSSQPNPETLSQTMNRFGNQGGGPPRCSKSGELRIVGATNNLHLENVPSMERMFETTTAPPVTTTPASAIKSTPADQIGTASTAVAKKGPSKTNKSHTTSSRTAAVPDDEDIVSVRRTTLRERKSVSYDENDTMDTTDAAPNDTPLPVANKTGKTTTNNSNRKGSSRTASTTKEAVAVTVSTPKPSDFDFRIDEDDEIIPQVRTPGKYGSTTLSSGKGTVLQALLRKSEAGTVTAPTNRSKSAPLSSVKSGNNKSTDATNNSFGVRVRTIPSISKENANVSRTESSSVFDFGAEDDHVPSSSTKLRSTTKVTGMLPTSKSVPSTNVTAHIIPELPTRGKAPVPVPNRKDEFAFDVEDIGTPSFPSKNTKGKANENITQKSVPAPVNNGNGSTVSTENRRGTLTLVPTTSKSTIPKGPTSSAKPLPVTGTSTTVPPSASLKDKVSNAMDITDTTTTVPAVTLESIAKTRTTRRKSSVSVPEVPPPTILPASEGNISIASTANDVSNPLLNVTDGFGASLEALLPVSIVATTKTSKGKNNEKVSLAFTSLVSDGIPPVLQFPTFGNSNNNTSTPNSTDSDAMDNGGVALYETAKTPSKHHRNKSGRTTADVINFSSAIDSMVSTDGFNTLPSSFDALDMDNDNESFHAIMKVIRGSIDRIFTNAENEMVTTKRRHFETLQDKLVHQPLGNSTSTKTLLTKYENFHQRILSLGKGISKQIEQNRNHIHVIQNYVSDIHSCIQTATQETETLRESTVHSFRQHMDKTNTEVRTALKQESQQTETNIRKKVSSALNNQHAIFDVTRGLVHELENLL